MEKIKFVSKRYEICGSKENGFTFDNLRVTDGRLVSAYCVIACELTDYFVDFGRMGSGIVFDLRKEPTLPPVSHFFSKFCSVDKLFR